MDQTSLPKSSFGAYYIPEALVFTSCVSGQNVVAYQCKCHKLYLLWTRLPLIVVDVAFLSPFKLPSVLKVFILICSLVSLELP